MKENLFKRMEILGVLVSFILACVLHFTYDWSNGAMWSILFGAVNESVWEHLKIITMPYVLWAFLEIAFAKPYFKQFVISKIFGIYFLGISIIIFYYSYTLIVGDNILWLDISSTILFTALAFYFSYKITTSYKNYKHFYNLALALLFLYFCMYFWFTISPPHIDLFKDSVTSEYGIYAKSALQS